MKKSLAFSLVFVSLLVSNCAYKTIKDYEQVIRTMDTIAVLPTVFNIVDNTKMRHKYHNDSTVCNNLNKALAAEMKAVLGFRYRLPATCEFRLLSPTLTKSVKTDMKYVNWKLNLRDTFIFSNQYLDSVNATNYRYVLINYMEGTYTYPKKKMSNAAVTAATAAVVLLTPNYHKFDPERSRIGMQSVLYDTRSQKVIYHKSQDYTGSVNNDLRFRRFVNQSVRKLYVR